VTQAVLQEARKAVDQEADLESKKLEELWKGSKEVNGKKLAELFSHTYRYSIDHSYKLFGEDSTVFVNTGDIPQMWLRDSTFQLHAYLPLAAKSKEGSAIRKVLESAMARQRRFILDDPYGSAFYESHGEGYDQGPNKNECPPSPDCRNCGCARCAPACGRYTYQKDFELDSLLFPLLLHYNYWKQTGSTGHLNQELTDAMKAAVKVIRTEQNHAIKSEYYYKPMSGSFAQGIGLVWSFALPSDDQAGAVYNVPENIMAAAVLEKAAEMSEGPLKEVKLAQELKALSEEIHTAVKKYGIVKDGAGKDMYAFSVDGLGQHTDLDDANLPNLLWLPYLDYSLSLDHGTDSVYETTRKFVLSTADRNFFGANGIEGLGSQHRTDGLTRSGTVCRYNCVWHLGLAMQGLTAVNQTEKVKVMNEILTTDAGKNLLHEGFEPGEPAMYNRDEFGWADSVFAEWVLRDWTTKTA